MMTILVVLSFGSALIGYNLKEKSFAYYALYTFLLLCYFISVSIYRYDRSYSVTVSYFFSLQWNLQVFYNAAYFLFFLNILNFKKYLPKIYKFVLLIVLILLVFANIIFLLEIFEVTDRKLFYLVYVYGIVPLMIILAVYTLIKTCKIPGRLKYYFIFGGVFYMIFSMISLFFPLLRWSFFSLNSFDVFNIGILGEQVFFAMGFAYKIKLMNLEIIRKSKENENIIAEQNILLQGKLDEKEQEILTVTAKAEQERLKRLRSKYESEINQLHLVSLQNQMNPHFIFNAMNSIKSYLIDNDKESAVSFLTKFSKLIRNILLSSRVEKISLEEELDLVKIYVDIENLRFENQVYFELLNPENIQYQDLLLPPMILQPFIENAIIHGLLNKDGQKTLTLRFSKIQKNIVLKITDNGVGRKVAASYSGSRFLKKESLGLKITTERLKYFNEQHKVDNSYAINDLENDAGEAIGTEVTFVFGETS